MPRIDRRRAAALIDRFAAPLGYGLLAVGGALLVLPGPGLPFLLGGLALLAPRRAWARRARRRLRLGLARIRRRDRPRPASVGTTTVKPKSVACLVPTEGCSNLRDAPSGRRAAMMRGRPSRRRYS